MNPGQKMSVFLLCSIFSVCNGLEEVSKMSPALDLTNIQAVTRMSGETALLTCVVTNQADNSLLWKKVSKSRGDDILLTAGTEVVSSDQRIDVLHEDGGGVYVLKIRNLTVHDAGLYSCELTTSPPLVSRHELKVLSTRKVVSLAPEDSQYHGPDMSACCLSNNVSASCLGLCSQERLERSVAGCEEELDLVYGCVGGGEDRASCCLHSGVPEECADLCAGQLTPGLASHCHTFSSAILSCLTGLQTVPGPPLAVSATAENDTTISVSWVGDLQSLHLTDHYIINTTFIASLTREFFKSFPVNKVRKMKSALSQNLTAGVNQTSLTITGLEAFTVYGISVSAVNKAGHWSLPSAGVKVVTHVEGERRNSFSPAPALPDSLQCCRERNVSSGCVEQFCDPISLAEVNIKDMITCAPWAKEMFGCLSDRKDHRPCCATRGVDQNCLDLCGPQPPTEFDFSHFSCLRHMSDMSACMLEGYGVLPSSPTHLRFSNPNPTFLILHWDPPAANGDSVIDYEVIAQKISPSLGSVERFPHVTSPYILEGLESRATYEVYVEATNQHGTGQPSSRLVMRTVSVRQEEEEILGDSYSPGECCESAGVSPDCRPLCTFDVTSSVLTNLTGSCGPELDRVVRCGAGGRDHLQCCRRRGVPPSCLPLCQAVHQQHTGADFLQCSQHLQQIFTCYEEGTASLPPPVTDLYAARVEDHGILLKWRPGKGQEQSTGHYQVFYKEVSDNETTHHVFKSQFQINTNQPMVKVDGLHTGKVYSFYVVSRNEKGSSLPSSILTTNISLSAWTGQAVASSSPPHVLRLVSGTTTSLQLQWNPPSVAHPQDRLTYRVYYRPVSNETEADLDTTTEHRDTDLLSITLEDLEPDTEYELSVTALTRKLGQAMEVESERSELLQTWTEALIPPFVQIRLVREVVVRGVGDQDQRVRKVASRLVEGGEVTVLCLATGNPTPRLGLSINGLTVHSQVSRLMTTVIHNITRDLKFLSCFAENGVGVPLEAVKLVNVHRSPRVAAPMVVSVREGGRLHLECEVTAWPAPSLGIFRDRNLTRPVNKTHPGIRVNAFSNRDSPGDYKLVLDIANVSSSDGGQYYCHAVNSMGNSTAVMGVTVVEAVREKHEETLDCCRRENVSSDCLEICSVRGLDYTLLSGRPECLEELSSLVRCGLEGQDRTECCRTSGVPDLCSGWCGGEMVRSESAQLCAISFAKQMIRCFNVTSHASHTISGAQLVRNVTTTTSTIGLPIQGQVHLLHENHVIVMVVIGLVMVGVLFVIFCRYVYTSCRRGSICSRFRRRVPVSLDVSFYNRFSTKEDSDSILTSSELESDNYHQEFRVGAFSLSSSESDSSSPSETPSPRETSSSWVLDRIRSGMTGGGGWRRF